MVVRDAYHQVVGSPDIGGPGHGPLRRSVAGSVAAKAAEMVTLVVLATVVPRVLGPGDFGHFSVPLTVVTLTSLALTLGGHTVMARYVPAVAPGDRVAVARAIGLRLARGRFLQLAALAAVAATFVVAAPDTFGPARTALVVAAVAVNVATTLALQIGLGLGRTGAWAARFPLQNAVLIVAVLALHDVGPAGDELAILVASLAAAIPAAFVVAPVIAADAAPVPVPEGAIRFGVFQATGAGLTQVAQRGGVLAVALLGSSATETGYAALCTGLALGATYAILQTFTVALPHLAAEPAETDRSGGTDASEAVLRRLAVVLLTVTVPAMLLAAATLDATVPLVFGDDYRGAVEAFGPALALVVLAPLNALAVQVAALRYRPEAAAWAGIAAAVVFVVVSLAVVPPWAATGAMVAVLTGMAASALVSVRALPGAVGPALVVASFAGTLAVLTTATIA